MPVERYSDIQFLVAKKAGVDRGQCVLDAGTGPGALLAIRLAELVGDDGLVLAIDREKEYVSLIKNAIAASTFQDRISFVLSDLRYVPIRDGSLDAAVSLDTVQNMYGNDIEVENVVKDYIKESKRIVKSGGKIVVGTRHPVPRNRAQEVYIELRLFGTKLEYMLWREQARYDTAHELASWFKKAGLQDIETKVIEHNIPYPSDIRARGNERIKSRLKQIEPHALRKQLEEEFQGLLSKLKQFGEEWLPTLLVTGQRRIRSEG